MGTNRHSFQQLFLSVARVKCHVFKLSSGVVAPILRSPCFRDAADETLLGKDGFRRGMDLYFDRHDGEAVTCDDFLAAMADANGEDLSLMSKCAIFPPVYLSRLSWPVAPARNSRFSSTNELPPHRPTLPNGH